MTQYTGTLISDLTAMVARHECPHNHITEAASGELVCDDCRQTIWPTDLTETVRLALADPFEPRVCTHPDCPLDGSLHNTDECVFALPEPEQDFDEYEAYVDRIAEEL